VTRKNLNRAIAALGLVCIVSSKAWRLDPFGVGCGIALLLVYLVKGTP